MMSVEASSCSIALFYSNTILENRLKFCEVSMIEAIDFKNAMSLLTSAVNVVRQWGACRPSWIYRICRVQRD